MPPGLSQASFGTSLSMARLAAFRKFFKAADDLECLGAMMWHQEVAAALWPLLGWVEVAFRNRAHYALSMLHGGMPSRPWYAGGPQDMRLRLRLRRRVDELLASRDEAGDLLIQGADAFVAETTFGFWIEVLYELAPDRRFRFCRMAMPGLEALQRKAAWASPALTWLPLVRRLERHKIFRDRIAHHAPLWRVSFEPEQRDGSILPSGPGALLQALRKEATALQRTLQDLEPGLLGMWGDSRRAAFLRLTTLATVAAYMGSPGKGPL